MKINELEKELNISRANIRFYEKEGLLNPIRKENNYRDYSKDEVFLLKKIIIYRKLGISISDIKKIFDGELNLTSAANKSINSIDTEISQLTVSSRFCKEILNDNLDDKDFNTELYWQKISKCEDLGQEFNDFIGIDITGFSNKKRIKFSVVIFTLLFFIGIIYSSVCSKTHIHNNEYYDVIQNEIDTPCVIDTVKVNTEHNLLYVCYDRATCVNVYDFEGNFKWAISLPFNEFSRRLTCFYLSNNKLIIDFDNDAYIYNAFSGEFIEKTYTEKLGISEWRDTYEKYHAEDIEKAKKHGVYFDYYDVYTTEKFIVRKPIIYILSNDIWGLLISFVGAIGLFLTIVLSVLKKFKKAPFNQQNIRKKARIISVYFKALFAVLLSFTVLNSTSFFLTKNSFPIGIFPISALFIISLVADDIWEKKFNNDEKKICGIWRHYCILAFFISVAGLILLAFLENTT